MSKITWKNGNRARKGTNNFTLVMLIPLVAVISLLGYSMTKMNSDGEHFSVTYTPSHFDYKVDDQCKTIPSIRAGSTYFLSDKVTAAASPENLEPSFKVGSMYDSDTATNHMRDDAKGNFVLMKEVLEGKEGGLALDMGANQGFFTYYLAALGMQVHSFEIDENNFQSLQQGTEYNPKDVSDRVHLYPIGLGEKNARFNMRGGDYEGFLKEGAGGNILGLTVDCFAYHMQGSIDFSNVAFVKLDVEGFEIAVLKGAQNSLFKHGYSNIGGMLMEVGPKRWGRASIDFATGLDEMKKLSSHFKISHITVRTEGRYKGSCPEKLPETVLSDKNPRKFENINVYKVRSDEWEPLLAQMNEKDYDCNFFYTN